MNPSCNLFIVGPTGAGKTTIGRRLAAHYGLAFVDLDQEIEERCGADVNTVFAMEGEEGFRRRESELLEALSARRGVLMATGAGAVLDVANRRHLRDRGFVLWMPVTVDQQLERLARDRTRPLLAVDDRRARLEAMAQVRTALYAEVAELMLPGEDDHLPRVSERCIALIDQSWQRDPVAHESSP
ncbi:MULTISPECIES: shikimate kinase [Dyella]|uniref:Shikimate kinase n=2 Tax=Dyella TaxID=231454 RepID=A0A4R0Z1R6_9GAMM|nr:MULTISPECIES: shikimate kinase [Dyella]TBR40208.1 shikimate kinase [Dyella terrae]TCI12210.1 shikimate kinase [Dyella soli]